MKKSFFLALLPFIFLMHQLFGIFILNNSMQYLESDYEANELSEYSYYLPLAILALSIIFLALSRFKRLIKYWHILALIICMSITLGAIIDFLPAIIVSCLIVLLKKTSDDQYFDNVSEFLIYPAFAIALMPLLNLISAIVLLLIICIYDIIAVYFSKHMVKLAKTQLKENVFSGIRVKIKKSVSMVGGGDIAFIMLFCAIILRDIGFFQSISAAVFSSFGLFALLYFGEKKKFYPAMPFLSISAFFGAFFSMLLISAL